ncbi:amino acid permease [Undibacterium sp. RTI2.1]|uniref:APC family permease n=1 Tax=unclassified Undibacterium TaxID=2630295 RepID=UPI002AB51BA3|nr:MULTISPECIES: amino acid permease [unclassified Undibacterium]MDY7536745.1 amino acid permease [Undibacterium sp. 5I1]MEB0032244.1 amino acid permease [Undibacterium sp. RTI2.1]MEB0115776.1 amino acid permease [Undibacterium sp. RTI2.2]MEB0231899.1 amino acid permease [Undibacterium sp. 10I3]MEB0256627.1 amino acid permease [Undibacterium sp. 5I1]
MGQQTFGQQLIRTKPVDASGSEVEAGSSNGLHRSLGLFSLTMIGVGATIGTGIFFTMVEAVPKAGPSVILSFILAAVTAGLTALCYAELSSRIPASGSSYSYAYATVGEFPAYIVAACLLLEYGLAASATAVGWSAYLNNFLANAIGWQIPEMLRSSMIVAGANGVEFHPGQINLPPIILVIVCGFLLLRGTKESATVNAVMVLTKLVILTFFAVVAFSGFNAEHFTPFFNPDNSKGLGGMAGVTAAAGTVFFSFIGLDTVATAGEEVKNPKRNVPLAILAALVIVTVFYLLVAVAAVGAQPASMFAGQEAGLSVILQNVTGKAWPALILSAGAVISVFSVTLVTIYGQTRILFAISKDGLISPSFQRLHARTQTPTSNTIIVCVVVSIVAGLVDATFLWDMVSMGTLVAFIVVSTAVPVMRAKGIGAGSGGFRVPFGPYFLPGLSILACLYIVKDLPPTTYKVFFIWMAVAIGVYFLYGMRHSRLRQNDEK